MGTHSELLDNYVGHKLSSLTECGAPELLTESAWLNTFILKSVFTSSLPDAERVGKLHFIRRAEGACFAYREARLALREYVTTPANAVSPYFRSLFYFEACVAQCWQGLDVFIKISGNPKLLFAPGDQSTMEKLNSIYNESKHVLPTDLVQAVWITNQGLESIKTHQTSGLSFSELVQILELMGRAAEGMLASATA